MTEINKKVRESEGMNRGQVRRALVQEAAIHQKSAEILDSTVQQNVRSIDRAIMTSLFWLLAIVGLFIALGFYWTEISAWAIQMIAPAGEAKASAQAVATK